MVDNEIPAVAPLRFADGNTLHQTPEGIYFALFPRCGGRSPEELILAEYRELGRLLGRIHNIAARQEIHHRPLISPLTYGREALALLLAHTSIPDALRERYVAVGERAFSGVALQPLHGDCHKGNLLRGRDGFFFLDFDDMGVGPAAQDLWLLLPGRRHDCQAEIDALLEGNLDVMLGHPPTSVTVATIAAGQIAVNGRISMKERPAQPSAPAGPVELGDADLVPLGDDELDVLDKLWS